MDADTLDLSCWIYGDSSHAVFPVRISCGELVTSLECVLMEQNPAKFDGVDALDLYTIPFPDDERLETTLDQWGLESQEPLCALSELSTLDLSKSLIIVYTHMLTFSCWVRGDAIENAFSVNISDTMSVVDLHRMVKNEAPTTLREVDPSGLSLYKVVLPRGEGDSLKGLGALTSSSLGEPMQLGQRLSDVVKPPPASHRLCLVVDGMPIPLECRVRGVKPEDYIVEINISMNDFVYQLKDAFKITHGLSLMSFFKLLVDEKGELRERPGNPGLGRALVTGNERLRDVFDDVPLFQRLRIVAEPIPRCSLYGATGGKRERPEYEDSLERGKRARRDFAMGPIQTPSMIFASLSMFGKEDEEKSGPGVRCGLPFKNQKSAFPLVLAHRIFATFVSECETYEPSIEDLKFTLALPYYVRFDHGILAYMDRYGIAMKEGRFEESEHFTAGGARVGDLPYFISVVKRDFSISKEDSCIEAATCHLAAVRDWQRAHPDDKRALPCLHVFYSGSVLGFAGSMLTDELDVNVFGPMFPLFCEQLDVDMQIRCARMFGAMRNATNALRKYYEQIESQPPVDVRFPWITQYNALSWPPETRKFRYLSKIEGGNQGNNFVYVCQHLDDERRVIVKFVQTYSKGAHLACAARGGAPALLGYQDILSCGWSVVVMELLGEPEWEWGAKIFDEAEERTVRDAVREHLLALHRQGYVHGDVRAQNVFVKRSDAEPGRSLSVCLVDFDWAGKRNEARYPYTVNPDLGSGVSRPSGVQGGGLITEEHDLAMLDLMY